MIVDAAFNRMLRDGYANTHMDDIAADCGISKRTLYRLFDNKLDMFSAMVQVHRHWMMRIPDPASDVPLEALLDYVLGVDLDPDIQAKRIRFLDVALVSARQFPELREILHRDGAERSRQDLIAFFESLRTANRLGDINPVQAAGMLMDLAFGALPLKSGQGSEWPGGGDRNDYLRSCVRLFVKGIVRT